MRSPLLYLWLYSKASAYDVAVETYISSLRVVDFFGMIGIEPASFPNSFSFGNPITMWAMKKTLYLLFKNLTLPSLSLA